MPYDINEIRRNIQRASAGKFTDPDEFKPEKAKEGAPLKYRFYILPPVVSGETLKSGKATGNMEQFFLKYGQHWFNNKPYACPRIWDNSPCPVCNFGFELIADAKKRGVPDEQRKAIVSQWMPSTNYVVNIFFTNWRNNPEDLRGKVKYYKAPKTCLDMWTATLMKDPYRDDDPEEEREAYGIFFDETAAFAFELVATKDGKTNGYKSSSFVNNFGRPTPMIMNDDKSANTKQIELLLKSRFDLFTKLELPDPQKLDRLVKTISEGDDSHLDSGFDSDEVSETQRKPSGKPSTVSEGKKPSSSETTKKRQEVVSDDDDTFSGEVPFHDEDDDKPSKSSMQSNRSSAKKSSQPSVSQKKPANDMLDAEFDDLLSQLNGSSDGDED